MRYVIVFLFLLNTVLADTHTVKIGVLAKRGHAVTMQRWHATALYLNQAIPNRKFKIVPIPFNDIFKRVKHNDVDFILANSGFYVELEYRYGAQRIVTLVNKHLTGLTQKEFGGVIFTHIDNKARFNEIEDIVGATMLAVNKHSFGGWQMAWRELVRHEIDVEDLASLEFVGTHDSTVYAILNKKAEIGTVRTDTLERMALEKKIDLSKFHIIGQKSYYNFPFMVSTALYPEWPLAKLNHTSDSLAKEVAVALMKMSNSSPAAIISSIDGWGTPLNYQPVHDAFKILEIPPYFQEIKFWSAVYKYWPWILFFLLLSVAGILMFLYQLYLTRNLEATQDELVQIEKMASLGRLVAGISHEINTPIGIGVTAASFLQKETKHFQESYKKESLTQKDFETFIEHAVQSSEMILSNLDRAANLIQSFKQISVDQSSDDVRDFYIDGYFKSIITSLKPTLKNLHHTVEVICPEALQIRSNPGVFYQIFSNLIINSVIHGFENKDRGSIKVSVRKQGQALEIIYKDNGKGMDKASLKKIFDPFFTTKRSSGGSGLGTHIVFNLVTQKLNGLISVESKVGDGLKFTLTFKDVKYV